MQTYSELLALISKNQAVGPSHPDFHHIVLSLSPQSRASLAAKYSLSLNQVHRRLTFFFQTLGVVSLMDITLTRQLALLATARELQVRLEQPSLAIPLLVSSCPGFICFMEKTHPTLLPHVSLIKSPMAIMGSFIKRKLAQSRGIDPLKTYHVSVMPCYDKKLEGSREELMYLGQRETDLVLTTGEVEMLMTQKNMDIQMLPESDLDIFTLMADDGQVLNNPGSTSGGYLQFTLKYIAQQKYGLVLSDEEFTTGSERLLIEKGRNADSEDFVLVDPSTGQELVRMAKCYGFRNIQNLVRRLSPKKNVRRRKDDDKVYHFVEVMACPSGCINGGGQLKVAAQASSAAKEFLKISENAYHSALEKNWDKDDTVRQLWDAWGHDDVIKTTWRMEEQKKDEPMNLSVNW